MGLRWCLVCASHGHKVSPASPKRSSPRPARLTAARLAGSHMTVGSSELRSSSPSPSLPQAESGLVDLFLGLPELLAAPAGSCHPKRVAQAGDVDCVSRPFVPCPSPSASPTIRVLIPDPGNLYASPVLKYHARASPNSTSDLISLLPQIIIIHQPFLLLSSPRDTQRFLLSLVPFRISPFRHQ